MTQHSLSLPTLALATPILPDTLPDGETCWQAVQRRDRTYNGRFWFSVRTTGVYCLPSCAARPALRQNVAFHASPDAAEAAGFRACKRCKPNGLAATVDSGIRFMAGACSLGVTLVATSAKGIRAILLGDSVEALLDDLHGLFPHDSITAGGKDLERLVASIIQLVEAPACGLDWPLDIKGTAFQRRVWQALRDIPVGSTASYAEVAASIGSPRAGRAVARACACNSIAVAIPCHRVVRSDGALSGYRWGVERKRALLMREAAR
jgi:AraC family transcriptional regulator of adaptative response/methylated-DNA-[protein]-cysteine methyltransferase